MECVGDCAVAIPVPGEAGTPATTARVREIAAAVERAGITGVVDLVPSPDRVTVCYDILRLDSLEAFLTSLARCAAEAAAHANNAPPPAIHEIPVVYGGDEGPDLAEVCQRLGIDRATLIARHTAIDYLVTAVGFTPGFAYLGGLPRALAVPRRATPRVRVPAGSVGIGGSQTGVYPFASPGGWQIIGRTSRRLFDPTADRPAVCAVGDRVRFVAGEGGNWSTRGGAEAASVNKPPRPSQMAAEHFFTVLSAGLMTSVQDLGRCGHRAAGVTPGGAADPAAAIAANLLAGNPPDAAVLEFTLTGPTLHFPGETVVALGGGEFSGFPTWRPVQIPADTTLAVGHALRGCRGYLAVAGGIDVPALLGSRSTHLAAGFGGLAGRPLAAGDRLRLGPAPPPPADFRFRLSSALLPLPSTPARLRLIPEPGLAANAIPWGQLYRVSARSDRMGLRLEGAGVRGVGDGVSRGVVPGTVQVPPDGQPILLGADCQTIGGYPVLGHVITADLRLAAQLRPGDRLCFEPATLAEAHTAWRERAAILAELTDTLADRRQTRLGP